MGQHESLLLHLVFNNENVICFKAKGKIELLNIKRLYVYILYFVGNFKDFQSYLWLNAIFVSLDQCNQTMKWKFL